VSASLQILDSDSTPVPLPDLQDAVLTEHELEVYFSDLQTHANVGEIILKMGATERARVGAPTLAEAQTALVQGDVRGVQIRYVHAARQWWDTLMVTAGGIRLVRIER
jgi:hypothetical protein